MSEPEHYKAQKMGDGFGFTTPCGTADGMMSLRHAQRCADNQREQDLARVNSGDQSRITQILRRYHAPETIVTESVTVPVTQAELVRRCVAVGLLPTGIEAFISQEDDDGGKLDRPSPEPPTLPGPGPHRPRRPRRTRPALHPKRTRHHATHV